MKWQQFLSDIRKATIVTLVGPLYGKMHVPVTPTIYIDAGAHFRTFSVTDNFAEVSVGDGDSAETELDEKLPEEKDYSDLAFALRHLPKSIDHVDLLGFLGGSRDHELINFGEVHHFLKDSPRFRSARFDDLVVAFAGGKLSMEIHGRFSVVVFQPASLQITGSCSYPLNDPTPMPEVSSMGLGNMGFGTVFVECTAPCFLFLGMGY